MADVLATPTARLTMIIGVTAAFLGLAVLGWGGFSAFFSHPALTVLVLASFAISVAAFQFGVQYDAYCARTSRLIPGVF